MINTRILRSLLIVLVVILAAFIFIKQISYLNHLKSENARIESRINKLRTQNTEYKNKIDSIKNDNKYIEKVLRQELGMIKEGEKIFKFNN